MIQIDLEKKIQGSNKEKTIFYISAQPEINALVEENEISPPLVCRSNRVHLPPQFYCSILQ